MKSPPPSESGLPSAQDWESLLGRFLVATPPAVAAEWDPSQNEVAIATLGNINESELRQRLKSATRATAKGVAAPEAQLRQIQRGSITRLEKPHGCREMEQLWSWRKIPWPSAAETVGKSDDEPEDWRVLALLSAACGVFGIAGFVSNSLELGPPWLAVMFYLIAMLAGGWDAARDALPDIPKGKLDIHFLMLAVAVGASLIGAFGEAALLLFLFSLAGALEHFALHRTRREIDALFRLAPKTARRRNPDTGEEESVAIELIGPADHIILRPGDTVPVDGKVVRGQSAMDEASLTGEAHPVEKSIGSIVKSGTQNLWGSLDIECLRPASESSLQKVIRLIEEARGQRAPSQRLIDRYGQPYTIAVLTLTTLLFFVWWLAFDLPAFANQTADGEWVRSALYRAMTLLVVASPCALVLSIPSAILAAIARGARDGILFRGGAAVEDMAKVSVVAFDKTGTLTTGELTVTGVESYPPGQSSTIIALAAALEAHATHPIASAIVQHARDLDLDIPTAENSVSLTGLGVKADIDGIPTLLGSRRIFEQGPLADWANQLAEADKGLTEVWLIHGERVGRILLRDAIRPTAPAMIAELRANGIETVMLTGDRPSAAAEVAGAIGLNAYHAGLSPEGKVKQLARLKAGGRRVAMVGDGINDAPVLAAADVAFAMGGRGSDASLEQSDVVLMDDRIENLPRAYQLSRRARTIILQNMTVALGTMLLMVAAAILGWIPIAVGVVAHEGSTVAVCLNSMRLLRKQPPDRQAKIKVP
jgi:Cd2+/Zn2+-exporting ATPase